MLKPRSGAVARYGILFVVASTVLALAVVVIIPYVTTLSSHSSIDKRRLVAVETNSIQRHTLDSTTGEPITTFDQTYDFHYVRVGDMSPNSSVWVLNPFDSMVETLYQKPLGSITEKERKDIYSKIDRFAFYQLVRLPKWLGGSENDTSAYRAYNAITLTVKCELRYWPDPGRLRLEDPCAGDMYRPWDGLAIAGPAGVGMSSGFILSASNVQGLPTLDLSVDNDGYIVAQKPDESPHKNGVAGEGRVFSESELQASNQALIDTANIYAGYKLPFTTQLLQGQTLKDIQPSSFDYEYFHGGISPYSSMQASYSYPDGFLTIDSALLDKVPLFNLSGSTITLRNGTVMPNLDNPSLSSLLNLPTPGISCYYHSSNSLGSNFTAPYSLKVSSHGSGTFAIFYAPDRNGKSADQSDTTQSNQCSFGDAIVWGKSTDGKDIIVHVHAYNYMIDKLVDLVQALSIK